MDEPAFRAGSEVEGGAGMDLDSLARNAERLWAFAMAHPVAVGLVFLAGVAGREILRALRSRFTRKEAEHGNE